MSISGDGRCMFSHSFTSSATTRPVLSLPLQLPLSLAESHYQQHQTSDIANKPTQNTSEALASAYTPTVDLSQQFKKIKNKNMKCEDSKTDFLDFLMCLNRRIIEPLASQNFSFWNDFLNEFRLCQYHLLKPILKNKHLRNYLYLIVLEPLFHGLF